MAGDVHAVGLGAPELPAGTCAWVWRWEDVRLECRAGLLPGERFCADHYIEHVQAGPDPDVRRFGPTTVTVTEPAR